MSNPCHAKIVATRGRVSIPGMTPSTSTARRLALVWGARIVLSPDVPGMDRLTRLVIDTAERLGYARAGQALVMAAGMPFGISGTAHLLRIEQVD